MTILVWLLIGLTAGVSANSVARSRDHRIFVELGVGLVASLIGGILFLALR